MTAPFRVIIPPEIWGDHLVSKEYPPDPLFKIKIATPRTIKTKDDSFSFQSFSGLDYFLELWTFFTSRAGVVSMKVEQAFIALVVCLKVGKRPFTDDIQEMNGQRYSLCYFPQGIYNIHLPDGGTVLAMVVPPIYHLHSMAIEHPAVKEMYNSFPFEGNEKIFLEEQPLPQTVLRIIMLLQQSKEQGASLDHTIRSYMLQLLSLYNKQLRITSGSIVNHILPGKEKTHQIIKYIHEHLTDERLDDTNRMAQLFKMNVKAMRKEFKQIKQKTIEHYIRDERLIYAKQLLEQTNLSVFEIAVMIGYSATSNFIRAYKRFFDHAPGEKK